MSWSFDVVSDRLEEIAGLRLDDKTIRRHCQRAAARLTSARQTEAPRADFAAAEGRVEFLADGVMVPTRDGSREVKVTRFLVRPEGESADPAAWADRDLPAPTASVCLRRRPTAKPSRPAGSPGRWRWGSTRPEA